MVWDPGRVATWTVEDMWMATGGTDGMNAMANTTTAIKKVRDNFCMTAVNTAACVDIVIYSSGAIRLPYCHTGWPGRYWGSCPRVLK